MAAHRKKQVDGDPPTVAEVRAVRAKMWKEAGGTIEGLTALVAREVAALHLVKGGRATGRARVAKRRRAATPRPPRGKRA